MCDPDLQTPTVCKFNSPVTVSGWWGQTTSYAQITEPSHIPDQYYDTLILAQAFIGTNTALPPRNPLQCSIVLQNIQVKGTDGLNATLVDFPDEYPSQASRYATPKGPRSGEEWLSQEIRSFKANRQRLPALPARKALLSFANGGPVKQSIVDLFNTSSYDKPYVDSCFGKSATGARLGLADMIINLLDLYSLDGIDINEEESGQLGVPLPAGTPPSAATPANIAFVNWTTLFQKLKSLKPDIIIQGSPPGNLKNVEQYAKHPEFTIIAPQLYNNYPSDIASAVPDTWIWVTTPSGTSNAWYYEQINPWALYDDSGDKIVKIPRWFAYLFWLANTLKEPDVPLTKLSLAVPAHYASCCAPCWDFGKTGSWLNRLGRLHAAPGDGVRLGIKNAAVWSVGHDIMCLPPTPPGDCPGGYAPYAAARMACAPKPHVSCSIYHRLNTSAPVASVPPKLYALRERLRQT